MVRSLIKPVRGLRHMTV